LRGSKPLKLNSVLTLERAEDKD